MGRKIIEVRCVRLDDLSIELDGPVFAKIDTQGAEPFVFAGGTHTLARADAIQVEWSPLPDEPGKVKQQTYPVKLTVICDDRAGMLKEFTAIISDDGTNIRSMESRALDDGTAAVEFVVETVDVRHLNKLVQNLRKVPGVRDVQRVQKI